MKLLETNKNWRVQSLGRNDINDPMRLANAKARADKAWGNMALDVGRTASGVLMDIYETSSASEAQELYVKALEEVNSLENKLYTNKQMAMGSAEMNGVTYDDSYQEMVDGEMTTKNYGYAPTHKVGAEVWSSRVRYITEQYASQASSDKVRSMLNAKIQPSITAKNQQVGRFLMNSAVADRKATIEDGINNARRVGDLQGALELSDEAYRFGVIDQNQANKYDDESRQQNDLRIFQEGINMATSEEQLSGLSNTVIFSDNFLTPAQRAQVANQSLSKIRYIQAQNAKALTEQQDYSEVSAIIDYHNGQTGVETLIDERAKYSRESFVRLYNRMTTKAPPGSDSGIASEYDKRIMNMQFQATDTRPVSSMQLEIMEDMQKSVMSGSLTYGDFVSKRDAMEKQAQIPFKTQQYRQTKETLLVDLIGTLDPETLAQAMGSMDIDMLIMKGTGAEPALAKLAMKAYGDLNSYMRTFGYQADPIQWWKDNKESYNQKTQDLNNAEDFGLTFPKDTIRLSTGAVDVQASKDNIVRQYKNGMYGPVGSAEALDNLDHRARILNGAGWRE